MSGRLPWQVFRLSLLAISCCGLQNSRHVCLLKKYSLVRGPHFNALFDQMVEQAGFGVKKRLAYLTTTIDQEDQEEQQHVVANELMVDLGLDALETFRLDRLNPLQLEERIRALDPTVLWAAAGGDAPSAMQLRYYMRTSGFDGLAERLCGSIHGKKSCLFVGEGAGATCCGSSMALATGPPAPEPQFRGLELLGPNISVCFDATSEVDENSSTIMLMGEQQVFVFSQKDGDAVSFRMNPTQKGAIENLHHPDPVPPLEEEYIGGRKCTGEPAVDPSRMLQMEGDSEWFEG